MCFGSTLCLVLKAWQQWKWSNTYFSIGRFDGDNGENANDHHGNDKEGEGGGSICSYEEIQSIEKIELKLSSQIISM